jgi:hypothetical protein
VIAFNHGGEPVRHRAPRPRHPHQQQAVSNNATGLLATGGVVWATNVIAFGLWYWVSTSSPRGAAGSITL